MDNLKYEAVRAKIVEACLDTMEIVEYCGWHDATTHHKCKDCIHVKSVLSLSHVLRAIYPNYLVDSDGLFWKFTVGGNPNYQVEYCNVTWNLEKDDLSLQRPEVWNFLFNILCE